MTEKQGEFFASAKPMDRMEMYDVLAKIYLMTCIHWQRISLKKFIRENAGETIRPKYTYLAKALIKEKILLTSGKTSAMLYKWNMKKHGPVSLFIADRMVNVAMETKREASRKHAMSRYYRGVAHNSPARKKDIKC